MQREKLSVSELQGKARCLRRHIIRMTATAGSGHPGGSLSAADIATALYFRVMNHDPDNPRWPDRDRLCAGKGHAAPLLYAVLAENGIFTRVLHMHTVKPLDEEAVKEAARETGAIVTAEEHLLHGGLGSRVARVVSENHPIPMRFIAIRDQCARSGKPDELLEMYALTVADIAAAVRESVALK